MMMRISLVLVAIVGLAGLRPAATSQTEAVASTTGLVVSWSSHASDVGAEILTRGGNAVDAAVATAFALAVTHPSAGNIGGGGFMIVRTPKGDVTSFDYREKAPLKATPTMYLDAKGKIDRSLTNAGYLAPACRAPCAGWRWRTRSSASCPGRTWCCRR